MRYLSPSFCTIQAYNDFYFNIGKKNVLTFYVTSIKFYAHFKRSVQIFNNLKFFIVKILRFNDPKKTGARSGGA
jgi:hypothetical protein